VVAARLGTGETLVMDRVPATRYARHGDVHLAFQVVGEGPVDLLMASGGQYPVDLLWDDPAASQFLGRLASFSRLVIFDARGWGASDGSRRAPTVEEWSDDLGVVMDAAGMERAAVFGSSPGGFFSMYFAAAHPERVSALVLMNTFACYLRRDDYPAGLPPERLEAATHAYVDAYGTGKTLEWFAPTAAADRRFREWWARCERLANGPGDARAHWRDLAHRDIRPILPALRVPTLVLHRRGDRFVHIDHGRYLAANIPDATYVECDGDDDLFFVGDTEPVFNAIEVFLTGVRGNYVDDRVLATVLFTDIVNSTREAARLGDRRWRDTLDHYDAIVARQLDRFRGRQIKTTGDGTLATFDGSARAIHCTVAIRDEVQSLGLELRSGLHAGEIELRGDDVTGIAVVIGQRVSALANGGEVLVSSTVKDLVAGAGIQFDNRAEHPLKGVPGTWQLYAVADI
jgi:class 3 adenylate cyclase